MTIEIALWNSERPALVDDDVADLLRYRWRLDAKGYVIRYCEIRVGGKLLHRMKLAHAILGLPGPGMIVDHINRDRLDNRRANLRFITKAQNAQNRSAHRNNVTRLRGVHLRKDTGRFSASVGLNGKLIRLGCYESADEAADVAREYRLAHMPYTVENS